MSRTMLCSSLPGLTAVLLLWATGVIAQEHSYAPSDIESGRGLYQANCLGCHGDNGSSVEGANLASGRFRRASSDEDLIALIRMGIPGTLMIPRPQLAYGDLRALVAFLRTMQTNGMSGTATDREVTIGDASRGAELFFGSAGCSTCHGVNGGGSRIHPDLAGIGSQRTAVSLEDAIINPILEVREGQRFMQVTDKAGMTSVGKLMNQDTHSIQLMNEQEQLVSFLKDNLQSWTFIPTPMPSSLDVIPAADIADLVAYLISLKAE